MSCRVSRPFELETDLGTMYVDHAHPGHIRLEVGAGDKTSVIVMPRDVAKELSDALDTLVLEQRTHKVEHAPYYLEQ